MATETAADTASDSPDDAGTDGGMSSLAPRTAVLMMMGMACFGSATPVSRIVGRSFPVWLGSMTRMATVLAGLVITSVTGDGHGH